MFDTAGMASDIAGNAIRGDHSTDQFVANSLNTVATVNSADIANTADIEHPSMDCSRGHRPVPEGCECPKQANPKV
jgi:hypothetical protein